MPSHRWRRAWWILLLGAVLSGCRLSSPPSSFITPQYTRVAADITEKPRDPAEARPSETDSDEGGDASDVHFVFAPYGWLVSADGDVSVRGVEADIDAGADDILDNLSFGAEGRFEVWKGDWGLTIDASALVLENEASATGIDVDVKSTSYLIGAAINRKVFETEVGGNPNRRAKLELGVGTIWTSLKSKIDFSGATPSVDRENNWFDLIVGGRGTVDLSERVKARVAGAYGGFGIGEASDQSWFAETLLGVRMNESGSRYFWFGYRGLGIERETGQVQTDAVLHGPLIGVSFRF